MDDTNQSENVAFSSNIDKDKPGRVKRLTSSLKEIPKEYLSLWGSRKISRWVENNNIYDSVEDQDTQKKMEMKRADALEKRTEELFPDDGKSDSPLINFFMSKDPMKSLSDVLITDSLEDADNKLQSKSKHLSTGTKIVLTDMITNKTSFKDAFRNTIQLMNQVKHGTDAESWMRQKNMHDAYLNRDVSDAEPSI